MPAALWLIPILALTFAPPLTDQQRRDLATAHDDGEYAEQAFYALIESIRGWRDSPTADGESIRLAPDLRGLTEHPADFRGDLCRITGELLQQTQLPPPYDDVSEWFVRDERGDKPVIVYVVAPDAALATIKRARVQVEGRFYKRMHLTARDRQPRDYAAFVGRFPVALGAARPPATAPAGGASNRGISVLTAIAGPIVVLMIVFVGLRLWIGRKGRIGRPARERDRFEPLHAIEQEVDDASGLPDDPVAALAELRRRAETSPPPT